MDEVPLYGVQGYFAHKKEGGGGAGPEGAEGLVRGGLGRRERHQHQRLAVACTPHRLMSE